MLFGLPFLGIGVFIILMAANVLHFKQRGAKAPPEVMAIAGVVFAAPGLMLIIHGLRGIVRRRRAATTLARRPDEPWFADYPWNSQGIHDSQAHRVFSAFTGMAYMALFASPMNYIAFFVAKSTAMKLFVIFGLDLFVAVFLFAFVYRLTRWLKYGAATLRFSRFPFHPGETLDLQYMPAKLPIGASSIVCTLRCIREAYETRPGYKRKTEVVVCYCIHEQTKTIDALSLSSFADRTVPVSFEIPSDAPATALNERPPTYWELEVSAETPGVDVNSRFLIPIYDRSYAPRVRLT